MDCAGLLWDAGIDLGAMFGRDAIMHISTPLAGGAGYTVNVNGQNALTFTAP